MVELLLKRGATSGRVDANELTIRKHLETFHTHSHLAVDYYKEKVKTGSPRRLGIEGRYSSVGSFHSRLFGGKTIRKDARGKELLENYFPIVASEDDESDISSVSIRSGSRRESVRNSSRSAPVLRQKVVEERQFPKMGSRSGIHLFPGKTFRKNSRGKEDINEYFSVRESEAEESDSSVDNTLRSQPGSEEHNQKSGQPRTHQKVLKRLPKSSTPQNLVDQSPVSEIPNVPDPSRVSNSEEGSHDDERHDVGERPSRPVVEIGQGVGVHHSHLISKARTRLSFASPINGPDSQDQKITPTKRPPLHESRFQNIALSSGASNILDANSSDDEPDVDIDFDNFRLNLSKKPTRKDESNGGEHGGAAAKSKREVAATEMRKESRTSAGPTSSGRNVRSVSRSNEVRLEVTRDNSRALEATTVKDASLNKGFPNDLSNVAKASATNDDRKSTCSTVKSNKESVSRTSNVSRKSSVITKAVKPRNAVIEESQLEDVVNEDLLFTDSDGPSEVLVHANNSPRIKSLGRSKLAASRSAYDLSTYTENLTNLKKPILKEMNGERKSEQSKRAVGKKSSRKPVIGDLNTSSDEDEMAGDAPRKKSLLQSVSPVSSRSTAKLPPTVDHVSLLFEKLASSGSPANHSRTASSPPNNKASKLTQYSGCLLPTNHSPRGKLGDSPVTGSSNMKSKSLESANESGGGGGSSSSTKRSSETSGLPKKFVFSECNNDEALLRQKNVSASSSSVTSSQSSRVLKVDVSRKKSKKLDRPSKDPVLIDNCEDDESSTTLWGRKSHKYLPASRKSKASKTRSHTSRKNVEKQKKGKSSTKRMKAKVKSTSSSEVESDLSTSAMVKTMTTTTDVSDLPTRPAQLKRRCGKPLEYWRGERYVYGRDSMGCPSFIGVDPGLDPHLSEFKLNSKRHTRKGSKNKPNVAKGYSDNDEMEVHVHEAALAADGFVWKEEQAIAVVNPLSGEEVLIDCVKVKESHYAFSVWGKDLDPKDDIIVTKPLSQKAFSAGTIELKARAEKGLHHLKHNTMVFCVVQGVLEATIHDTRVTVKKGDLFFVPQGNKYNLRNATDFLVKLVYFQLKNE